MKNIFYIFFLIIIVSFSSCGNDSDSPVPDYAVALNLNLTTLYPTFKGSINDTLVFDKYGPDSTKYLSYHYYYLGYSGVLVYTDLSGNYLAFDLCCPYEVDKHVRVYPQEDGTAVCPKCGSTFILYYGGQVSKGPSIYPLKQYQVNYSSTVSGDYLIIRN